jgi:cobalt-zinc-cadmium efflux system outer membrane protein
MRFLATGSAALLLAVFLHGPAVAQAPQPTPGAGVPGATPPQRKPLLPWTRQPVPPRPPATIERPPAPDAPPIVVPPMRTDGNVTLPGIGGPDAFVLDLPTALRLAEESSPRLRIAAARVEGARSSVVTAGQYPNPDFEYLGGAQRDRVNTIPSGAINTLGLAQPLDLPWVREPRIRSAEAGLTGTQLSLAETRLLLRASVTQAFLDVLRRKAEYELAFDNQRLFEQIRKRIEVRVNVGEAPKFELTRADAELSAAVNATNSARLRVAQAIAVLRSAIGAPLPANIDVSGELPTVPTLPSLDTLRDEAISRYPAIAQAQAEVRRTQARLETERALRIPQPTIRAGVEQDPEANKFRLGVSLPLPVFNQRQGQIGEAVAAFQAATVQAEQVRVEVRAALENAYSRYDVARAQIAAFEGGLLRQAENALKVAEAAFRFGERGFIDVLDAQRVLRQVRNEFLAARFELQAALVEIERLRAAYLDPAYLDPEFLDRVYRPETDRP